MRFPSPGGPKVAYITSTYPKASHTFILREVTALEDLGFEVLPCAIRAPERSELIGAEEEQAYGRTFYILRAAKSPATLPLALLSALRRPKRLWKALKLALKTPPPGLRGLMKQSFYLGEALILARRLAHDDVAHIHNHFADHSANVSLLTSALTGIPFSYTLHGPNELYSADSWALDVKTAEARFVACISHFARSQVMYFSDPEHWDKLRIIHCGVLPERYDRPRLDHEGVRLIYVGRLTAIKGLQVLLEAMEIVNAQRGDVALQIVGDGEDRAHLEDLVQRTGANATFLGYRSQEQVAEHLAEADMLVLPSFAEGLPVVLMEALAAGTPVICSQVAGVAELVQNGQSGYTVPAGDVATLAARILELAGDPALRQSMGQHGREMVKRDFDIRIEAARIATLFSGPLSEDLRPNPYGSPTREDIAEQPVTESSAASAKS